jgi:hypothetical protein
MNASRAVMLASMDRLDKIVNDTRPASSCCITGATSKALPKFPAYLQ